MGFRRSLIAVVGDALLVGEQRRFSTSTLEQDVFESLLKRKQKKLCVLSVSSLAEIPLLVEGRWVTEASILSMDSQHLVVCGDRRVRLTKVKGEKNPYFGMFQEVETSGPAAASRLDVVVDAEEKQAPVTPPIQAEKSSLTNSPTHDIDLEQALANRPLLKRLGELLYVTGEHPLSLSEDEEQQLHQIGFQLLRLFASPSQIQSLQNLPLVDAIAILIKELQAVQTRDSVDSSIEELHNTFSQTAVLSEQARNELWNRMIELQKKYGLYSSFQSSTKGSRRDPLDRLAHRLEQARLPPAAKEVVERELDMLAGMSTTNSDYQSYTEHLEHIARIPWHTTPRPKPSLSSLEETLHSEHMGLHEAKQRLLEHLAVWLHQGEARGTVLCLVGPPGTGKTSFARSIAKALGREFVRIALGGVHDESEIRGHRLSFRAAAPGRIIRALQQAKSNDPLILLDEIDKLGNASRSPMAAMLEVLDPEQHHEFVDNYIGVPCDLSNVFFLCTANDLSSMPHTLRDRFDLIELEGYSFREKIQMSQQYLLPRMAKEHALAEPLPLTQEEITFLLEHYTREPGVRELSRLLSRLHRYLILQAARAEQVFEPKTLPPFDEELLQKILGPSRYKRKPLTQSLRPGVVLGLGVQNHTGSILRFEAGFLAGAPSLQLTGRMGEVMQEAVKMGLAHLKLFSSMYELDAAQLDGRFFLHAPEAAVPKDGPSAGVAICLAMLSAITHRPLRADLAVTAELSLHGEVLPVGGLRAKLLAAERQGLQHVILSTENQQHITDELASLRLQLHWCAHMRDVLPIAFASTSTP